MTNDPRDWVAVISAAGGQRYDRRVAGLSPAARIAAEACAAGAREIRLPSPLDVAMREELARCCPSARIGSAIGEDAPGRPRLILTDRYFVDAAALRRLMAGPGGQLSWRGVVVASTSYGSAGWDLADAEAIDLAAPGAARLVMKRTAKPSDGLISRWLNRPVSQRLSALLLAIGDVRPWQATAAVAATAAAMFAAFLIGGEAGLLAGGLLFHAASVLDGVDGEIARATYRANVSGAAVDTAVDMATNLLFYLGVTIALTRLYGSHNIVAGGWSIAMALAGLALLGLAARRAGRGHNLDVLKSFYRAQFPTGVPRRIVELLVTMTSRDFFAFGFAVMIVAGIGSTVAWTLAGFATLWFMLVLLAMPALLARNRPHADAPKASAAPA